MLLVPFLAAMAFHPTWATAPQELPKLPEGDAGIAARYPGDKGIEKDPAVLWHDDFEAGTPVGRWDMVFHEPQVRMASEPENVHTGKQALKFTVPKTGRRRQQSSTFAQSPNLG